MGEARNSVNLIQLGMRQQNRRDSLKGGDVSTDVTS